MVRVETERDKVEMDKRRRDARARRCVKCALVVGVRDAVRLYRALGLKGVMPRVAV